MPTVFINAYAHPRGFGVKKNQFFGTLLAASFDWLPGLHHGGILDLHLPQHAEFF